MVAFDTNAPTGKLTIKGIEFTAHKAYTEGHTLTENEANALNQTLFENLRNNFASAVVNKAKEHSVEVADLSEDALSELAEAFEAYEAKYEFGARVVGAGGGSRITDPVQREAMKMARQIVRDAYKAKGYKISDVPAEDIERLATDLLHKQPKITDSAKQIVAQRQTVADNKLDLADLGVEDKKAA